MSNIHISNEGVIKILKVLNPSKALGPDELHPIVLKELAGELGPVFAHLFQQSLDKGEIPKEWSLANICPLCKKGDRALPSNCCPVSLTCIPCKMLEHIVCTNIMAHLDKHKLLSDRQHAFRKNCSCEIQLITVINDWTKILDAGDQLDTFILDFQKAFDTPSHELLKCKLHGYGISGKTLVWIDSFLCNGQQRVVVNGAKSQWAPVLSGVLQGTVLKGRASIPCDDLQPPNRRSRNQHPMAFQMPYARTDNYKYSFFPDTIRDWNALSAAIISSAESSEDPVARFTSPLLKVVKSRD